MRLPSGGYHPALRSLSVTGGLETSADTIQGYDVYRFTSPGGIVQWQAPALNFFALVEEFGDTRQECSDITVRYEGPELFVPPAGASVEPHPNELRGIVSYP